MSGNAGLGPPSGDNCDNSSMDEDSRTEATDAKTEQPSSADPVPPQGNQTQAPGAASGSLRNNAYIGKAASMHGNAQVQGGSNNTQVGRDLYSAGGDINHASGDIHIHRIPLGARATPRPSLASWQGSALLPDANSSHSMAAHLARAQEQLDKRRYAVIQSELTATTEDLLLHLGRAMDMAERMLEASYAEARFGGSKTTFGGESEEAQRMDAGAALDAEYAPIDLDKFVRELLQAAEPRSLVLLNLSDLSDRDANSILRELARLRSEALYRLTAKLLAEKQLYCIFIFSRGSEFAEPFDDSLISFSLEEEERLLVEAAAAKVKVPGFKEKLQQQIDTGIWGSDRARRLQDLLTEIRDGDIVKKVAEFANTQLDKDGPEYEGRLKRFLRLTEDTGSPNLADICRAKSWSLNQGEELVVHALFILTHFEDLTADDFNWLMRRLLADKTTDEVEEVVEIAPHANAPDVARPGDSAPAGKQTIRRVMTQVPLKQAVANRPDHVLALLDVQKQRSGRIDFQPAFKARIASDIFRLHLPVRASALLSEDTIDRAILFEGDAHIAEKLAKAYADHIRQLPQPSRFNRLHDWMKRSTLNFIERHTENLVERHARDAPGEFRTFFDLLLRDDLSKEYAQKLGRMSVERWSLLFSELLRDAETRPLVALVFQNLFFEGQADPDKFEIVMHFIRRLRRHEGFDTLHWLKRLLSEGDPKAKTSALRFLTSAVEAEGREGGVGADGSVLAILRTWLTDAPEEATGLNNQTAALLAPGLAMLQALSRLEDKEHGHVTRLEPLIDLTRDDGTSRGAGIAVEILAFPTKGPWPVYLLASLEHVVKARWHIELADWYECDWRQLALVGLLIETITAVTGDGRHSDPTRISAVRAVLDQLVQRWPAEDRAAIDSMVKIAYDLYRTLYSQKDEAAHRRGRCAKLLGEELYDLSRNACSA